MKKLFFILSFLFLGTLSTFSQQTAANQQQNVVLKPKFVIGDFVFAFQVLNSIEIKGAEVDQFLGVKTHFKPTLEKLTKENKQLTDSFDVEVPLNVANNFLAFIERGKFSGVDAEKYKRFVNSFQEAAKNYKETTPANQGK